MKLLTLLMMIISIILAGCDTTILPTPDDEVSYTITTIAGSGAEDDEGQPATEAFLTSPRGVAVDDHGNVYIADTENHRIRKVDAESGVITTIAGTGEEGYGGDEGPATEAKLNWPTGVAVDDAGNVYIADRNNERVRRVDPEGIIATFAGTGEWGFGGCGFQLFWQDFSGNSGTPKEESTEGLGRRFMRQSRGQTDPAAGRGGGCAWRVLRA